MVILLIPSRSITLWKSGWNSITLDIGCSNTHHIFLLAARTSKHRALLHRRFPNLTAALSGLPSGRCLDRCVLPLDLSSEMVAQGSEYSEGWDSSFSPGKHSKTDLLGDQFRIPKRMRIVVRRFQRFWLIHSSHRNPKNNQTRYAGMMDLNHVIFQSWIQFRKVHMH